MHYTGTIAKLNEELKYGFLKVPKLGDVFFSVDSTLSDNLSFDSLEVGQKLQIEMIETERGMFAKSLALQMPKKKPITRRPEASL
jgi:cold shock CspA family protein